MTVDIEAITDKITETLNLPSFIPHFDKAELKIILQEELRLFTKESSPDNNLLSETLYLLRNAPRHISFVDMSAETGCSVSWISRLASEKISDPGVKNVQLLFNYLKRVNDGSERPTSPPM